MKIRNLTQYLRRYYKFQDKILLVYHPEPKSNWADRCFYLESGYIPNKQYNHRSILKNEVVIEYDNEDYEQNKRWVDQVCVKLREDNIQYSKWKSGNKSVHLHFLIDVGEATNIKLLKRVVMRYYTRGLPQPDMGLASDNHLVRAEYGVHEKTGRLKSLISKDSNYPSLCRLPSEVWEEYGKAMSAVAKRQMTISVDKSGLEEHPGFKHIITPEEFRITNDGRERALYIIVQVIKSKFETKHQLSEFLKKWYRYSGGTKLDDSMIESKVNYHWNRDYEITETHINDLMYSIGRRDLIHRNK